MKNLTILLALVLFFSCNETVKEENTTEKVETKIEKKQISDKEYVEKGKKIAMASFGAMSGKLMAAMKSGGVEKAVGFCNLNASEIVDSLSNHYNVDIKRTSLKLRNSKNEATVEEKEILDLYKTKFDSKEQVKPIIKRNGDVTSFYAPIKLKGACLKCHGTVGEDIKNEDYSKIKALYENDEAIGFKTDDFRGIWHITFKK